MFNGQNKLYNQLGLMSEEDESDVELVFEEQELTREQCYDICRQTAAMLQDAGCGPFTVFKFKEECNNLARRGSGWKAYYAHCAKYIEYNVRKGRSRNDYKRISY